METSHSVILKLMAIEFEYKPNQTCVYIPASALTSAMIWGHSFAFLPVKWRGGGGR